MAKKTKITAFKIEGGLEEFLSMLQGGAPEGFEQVLNDAAGISNDKTKVCNNPLCPSCMHEHGLNAEQIGAKVMDTFRLLEEEQKVQALCMIYGLLAKCYNDFPAPFDIELGQGIKQALGYLRSVNEKFAFATDPGKHGEVAKH